MPSKTAGVSSALAKGFDGLTSGIMTREQAQLQKKQAEYGIKKIDYASQEEVFKAELDAVKAESKKTKGELTRRKTFDALTRYSADLDPRHLNDTLGDDFNNAKGIAGFRRINPDTDSRLYASRGFTAEDFTAANLPDTFEPLDKNGKPVPLPVHGRFMVATMKDGSEQLVDAFEFKKATGWFKQLSSDQVAAELERAKLAEPASASSEWLKKANDMENTTGRPKADTMNMLYKDAQGGNTAGKMDMGEAAEKSLDEAFEGNFVANYDPANPEHRAKAHTSVERIEAFKGVKLSASDRTDLKDIGMLLTFGDPSKAMTSEETGVIDSLLTDASKYFSDEYGSEGVAAYAAFRNTIRHALYGSALTDSEVKAFSEQFGSRKQKLGPLLKQMKTAMGSIQGKLDAMDQVNNPYVSRYRMGVSQDRIDSSITSLSRQIKRLDDMANGIPVKDKKKRFSEMDKALGK